MSNTLCPEFFPVSPSLVVQMMHEGSSYRLFHMVISVVVVQTVMKDM